MVTPQPKSWPGQVESRTRDAPMALLVQGLERSTPDPMQLARLTIKLGPAPKLKAKTNPKPELN